jgi:hypothetical protein
VPGNSVSSETKRIITFPETIPLSQQFTNKDIKDIAVDEKVLAKAFVRPHAYFFQMLSDIQWTS